jgi:hypothetical protein
VNDFFKKYNEENISENISIRQEALDQNSYLFMICKEIIDGDIFVKNEINDSIENKNVPKDLSTILIKGDNKSERESKQILLETFILKYEKEFTLNLIRNMNNNISDYKLITRILKHNKPSFLKKVHNFKNNFQKRNFAEFKKWRTNLSKYGHILTNVMFLIFNDDEILGIIFNKIIRLTGNIAGIRQNELIATFADELLKIILFKIKYIIKYKTNRVEDKLNSDNIYENLSNKLSKEE